VGPEPQGAETFSQSRYLKFRLRLPAPGQTKVAYENIIHIEEDQASKLNRYSFLKIIKNLLFNLKAVQTVPLKAEVGAGSGAETF
jgi:hypothetical protein